MFLGRRLTYCDVIIEMCIRDRKKSDVTGSVTSVGKERLGKLPVTNVLQAVQGAAAGVTMTQTASIPGDAPEVYKRQR